MPFMSSGSSVFGGIFIGYMDRRAFSFGWIWGYANASASLRSLFTYSLDEAFLDQQRINKSALFVIKSLITSGNTSPPFR